MDKVRFGEHARLWHNQFNSVDECPQYNVFPMPPYQQQQLEIGTDQYHRPRDHCPSIRTPRMTPINGSISAHVNGQSQGSHGYPRLQDQQHHERASIAYVGRQWNQAGDRDRDRQQKNQSISSGYPPRKSLIDTFVERNDDYWKSRVTIKIDVAHTDHSHIIGKQGRNTQTVMKDTGCHIHFPDANRNPDLEKSNMVSIAGPMQMVDKARRAIRDLAPLVITLEMKDSREDSNSISEDPLLREIAIMYGLNTLVRTNRSSGMPFFVVRGSVHQTKSIRDAVLRLQQRFMKTTNATCSLALDILRPQQATVVGRNGANIQLISQRTGATIHYPKEEVGQATTFFIRGTIDAILSARQHVIGCLPISFVFEVERAESMPRVDDLQREFGLSIAMRASRNGEALVVIVKAQERQATQVYAVRRRLIGGIFPDEPSVVANDYDFMRDFPGTGYIPSPNMDVAAPGQAANGSDRHFSFSALPYSPVSAPWYSNTSERHFSFSHPPSNASIAPSDVSSVLSVAAPSTTISMTDGDTISITDESRTVSPSHFDPVPEEAPLASSILEAKKKIQKENTSWKAPGAERSSSIDYDQQQVLATKAMREKPQGPRFPTDQWSGYGFSRSMPAAAAAAANDKQYATATTPTDANHDLKNRDIDQNSDEHTIGPWPMTPAGKHKKAFTATNYFEGGGLSLSDLSLSDEDDVTILLSRLHLAKYVDMFREQEVDLGTFLTMTDSDLKELGVNTFGARRKLLVIISELKEQRRRGQ